jgi:PKD repeat protein
MQDTARLSRRDVLAGMGVAGVAGATGVAAGETRAGTTQIPTGECIADWPGAVEDQLELGGETAVERGTVPDSGDLVLYIHGLFGDISIVDVGGDLQAAGFDEALSERAVEIPLVSVMWPATGSGGDAAGAAETLAPWLEQNHDAYDSLVVFAHSAGSEVILEALDSLADTDATVTSVGLFGGSADPGSVCDTYADGITGSVEGTVYNYHSEGDTIICTGPPFAGPDYAALGCEGSDCASLPENFVDVDLTGTVEAHCNYFKPASMEYDGESGVPEIVDRQLDAFQPPAGTVTGTVSVDGPVASTRVEAVNTDTGGIIESAAVGEDGTFSFDLPPGEYVVRVDEAGLEPFETAVTVESETTQRLGIDLDLAPVVGDTPPKDVDGDGLYRDVRGDGTFDIDDVQALFDNLDSPAVQGNAERFDFRGGTPDEVTIFDVQALFLDLRERR